MNHISKGIRAYGSPVYFGLVIDKIFKKRYVVYAWISDDAYQVIASCGTKGKMETVVKALNLLPVNVMENRSE